MPDSVGHVGTPVIVDRAGLWDAEALSDVAAATFPLACPPGATADDIEIFISEVLSGERFGEYLSDPSRTVLKAMAGGEIVGYAMLVGGEPADPEVAAAVEPRPVVEISKMYVLPGHHGTGVSTALMVAALDRAREDGYPGVWLGVNQENARAQRFYAKHGFDTVGTKTFTVGNQVHHDYVMQLVF
ncbi:GNAT family N-acetyltransferase [Nocardia cyriacigeorgica]|uniref:GNAT family N-acetyltransferase n=1 Tax=Nocardia cyriacigeorgica TaxID=135487 RepID=UPI0002D266AA|nr:GNAT family N-acetyltransferase [Nocardia cyriacigeorgica]MBF6322606.1 GNAT family N-acetyltransferase [Nocardia cyriacigeorgica]MBF6495533.1 GNAT family N-acetyltransferase [Nocardia cyriacigeorgica]TLF61400.1 GNAT family N-acetyltransferase [Nocardia cyriacigeorgica]